MDCITWDRYSIKIDLEVRTDTPDQDQPGLDLDQPSHYVPQASVCGGLGG